MAVPHTLRLIDGAFALDGGSIAIEAMTTDSKPVQIFLDWSVAAQQASTTRLEIDGRVIAKRSSEEADWIASLSTADSAGDKSLASVRDSLLEKLRSSSYAKESA